MAASNQRPPTPLQLHGRERKTTIRILVVEDNPVNQQLAVMMLASAGYQSDVAANGKAAVARYTATPGWYDAILMDVQMPEMGGIEATRAIRQWETTHSRVNREPIPFRRVPILAMTGQPGRCEREKCLAAGMDGVFTKPIPWPSLFQRVEEIIMHHTQDSRFQTRPKRRLIKKPSQSCSKE